MTLDEYELHNDAIYFIAGKENNERLVVLRYNAFHVIVHVHDACSEEQNVCYRQWKVS